MLVRKCSKLYGKKTLPVLLSAEKQILIDQVIDDRQPGSILADFETLLAFIGKDGMQVSGKYNLLPLHRLPELNERVTSPIKVILQRPQQRSYPNINSLYLLLRFTGLAQIKITGKK
ncbi:MAG TPA: hypothetical protein VM187_02480 [Niastella sp.]|nr:hypothetical protein [Niastella sp.]